MFFKAHAVDTKTLNMKAKRLAKRFSSLADDTQDFLMSAAALIEKDKNVDPLTNLITAMSEVKNGKVVLSSESKQIGRYMLKHLPIRWDNKDQNYKMKRDSETMSVVDWDYENALKEMEAVRWDRWGSEKADNAFDEKKAWATIMKLANTINKETADDNEYHKKAAALLRAFPKVA